MTDKKGIDTSFERLPNREAERHFNQKSLITSAEFANFKAHQHALAFTVAGLADKDMLAEVQRAVKSAIDNGTSFNEFQKSLKPFLVSKGWLAPELTGDDKADKALLKDYERVLNRRLKTIYHTNKQTAYAAGKWERIQKTKDFLPYLQYLKSASVNKRDGHKAYYGIVRPVDDPIWQSIFPPNGFGCKCSVKQITKSKARELGITDDETIEKLPTPEFDSNFDRLGALLRLAEDKHGKEFAEKLGADLKGEMVGYAVKGGVSHTDFKGITPRPSEVARLEKELNGDVSPLEGAVADEWQQFYDEKLERFDPDTHKVLAYNTKTNTPKSADYAIVDLAKDPKSWVTLDLMFTVSQAEADIMANMALKRISNKNPKKQAKIDGFWSSLKETIDDHLQKADIVPMDLRKLDPELVVKIIGYVLSLPKEQQKQVVLITG